MITVKDRICSSAYQFNKFKWESEYLSPWEIVAGDLSPLGEVHSGKESVGILYANMYSG